MALLHVRAVTCVAWDFLDHIQTGRGNSVCSSVAKKAGTPLVDTKSLHHMLSAGSRKHCCVRPLLAHTYDLEDTYLYNIQKNEIYESFRNVIGISEKFINCSQGN